MSTYPPLDEWETRHAICTVGRYLYDRFLVAANDGNITVRLSDDEILATPTGVSKGMMLPENLVVITPKGEILRAREGQKPSSEIRMHLAIFQERPDVRSVVHAHPPTATGFAAAGVGLDVPIIPEVVVRTGLTPYVPYAIPGGEELPDSLRPYMKDHDTLLMGNHGVVTYGPTLQDAWEKMETVEFHARIRLVTEQLGQKVVLNEDQVKALFDRYKPGAYKG
jgi:L-fuculose-phosphate aldolase